mgnify:CR=1 FL=1
MIMAARKMDQFFFHWKLYLLEDLFGAKFYCEYLLKFLIDVYVFVLSIQLGFRL